MELQIVEDSDVKIVEGAPNEPFMSRPEDAAQIIEACFSSGARMALLYADNLTNGFFDLSSGEAGAILQRLRNYGIPARGRVVTDARVERPIWRDGRRRAPRATVRHLRYARGRSELAQARLANARRPKPFYRCRPRWPIMRGQTRAHHPSDPIGSAGRRRAGSRHGSRPRCIVRLADLD